MLHALSLYARLLSVQVRSQLQFRASFFMEMLATALLSGTAFFSIALVLQRFKDIAGWSVADIAFLYGMVEVSFALMDMVFSGFDPPLFGRHVRTGSFDQLLLRPVSITLQIFGSEFLLRRTGRLLQAGAILGIALFYGEIAWTAAKLLYMPVIMLSNLVFFGGLFMTGAAITFWTVESIEVINIFTYGGKEMVSYPMDIYPSWMIKFFTFVIPAIFINYYPALYILDKPDPLGMPAFAPFLAPFAGAFMLALGNAAWKFSLRHYQSTGS